MCYPTFPSLTPALGFSTRLEDPDIELALHFKLGQLLCQVLQQVLALLPLLLGQHQPCPLTVGVKGASASALPWCPLSPIPLSTHCATR